MKNILLIVLLLTVGAFVGVTCMVEWMAREMKHMPARVKSAARNIIIGLLTAGLLFFVLYYCTGCKAVKRVSTSVEHNDSSTKVNVEVGFKKSDSLTSINKLHIEGTEAQPGKQLDFHLGADDLKGASVQDAPDGVAPRQKAVPRYYYKDSGGVKVLVVLNVDGSMDIRVKTDSIYAKTYKHVVDSVHMKRVADSSAFMNKTFAHSSDTLASVVEKEQRGWWWNNGVYVGSLFVVLLVAIYSIRKNVRA